MPQGRQGVRRATPKRGAIATPISVVRPVEMVVVAVYRSLNERPSLLIGSPPNPYDVGC